MRRGEERGGRGGRGTHDGVGVLRAAAHCEKVSEELWAVGPASGGLTLSVFPMTTFSSESNQIIK